MDFRTDILLCLLALATQASWAMYPSSSDVVDLTDSNFDRLVLQSDVVWVVEFFAPWCGHCQALVPEYTKLATALKGVAKVGAVDAEQQKSLAGRYGIQGFPTIKMFGVDKKKPADYQGERTARGIANNVFQVIKAKVDDRLGGGGGGKSKTSGGKGDSKDVIELTDENFDSLVTDSEDMWLVEFYAPWCGHCQRLAPHWAEAATELKGKVKLGALDATAHKAKASQYQIQGFPTIKYFPPGRKGSGSAESYEGGRTASDIVQWATDKLSDSVPPPEVMQVTRQSVLRIACEEHPLCVVSVLPHLLDCQSECRNNHLSMLSRLGDRYRKKQWGWVWAEAGAQMGLEESLEIGGFGYPALAVLNAKKNMYSILRGPFSEDGIADFLREVSYASRSVATFPIKGAALPKVVETESWDGKDGELEVEEDLDLSDVDLDEHTEL